MLLVTAIALTLFVLPPGLGVALIVVALVAEVAELALWRRFLDRYRVVTGAEGLVGERAEIVEPLAPEGTVKIRGEIWKARAETTFKRGETVEVAAVEGLTLHVRASAVTRPYAWRAEGTPE